MKGGSYMCHKVKRWLLLLIQLYRYVSCEQCFIQRCIYVHQRLIFCISLPPSVILLPVPLCCTKPELCAELFLQSWFSLHLSGETLTCTWAPGSHCFCELLTGLIPTTLNQFLGVIYFVLFFNFQSKFQSIILIMQMILCTVFLFLSFLWKIN